MDYQQIVYLLQHGISYNHSLYNENHLQSFFVLDLSIYSFLFLPRKIYLRLKIAHTTIQEKSILLEQFTFLL